MCSPGFRKKPPQGYAKPIREVNVEQFKCTKQFSIRLIKNQLNYVHLSGAWHVLFVFLVIFFVCVIMHSCDEGVPLMKYFSHVWATEPLA